MERWSCGPILDPDVVFPVLKKFKYPTKLPTKKSVICSLRFYTENKFSQEEAIQEVSKRVCAKWYHDTVYCVSIRSIRRRMKKIWYGFREGKRGGQVNRKKKLLKRTRNWLMKLVLYLMCMLKMKKDARCASRNRGWRWQEERENIRWTWNHSD